MADKNNIELLRHHLATIAYRFQKSISRAPDDFENFELGKGVRTPRELLNHMSHDLLYAKLAVEVGKRQKIEKPKLLTWQGEVDRFHETLAEIDKLIASATLDIQDLKIVLQGPLSDVMTHIGQLAMLSRLSGSPVKGEDFMKAKITTDKVDQQQDLTDDLF